MSPRKYCMVIPPGGAARAVGIQAARSLVSLRGTPDTKIIDSATYLDGFTSLLKTADVNIPTDLFNQSCAIACLDFGATHCIVCSLTPVTLFTLNLLKKYNIVTAHWFYEDIQKATYWKSVVKGYHHFFAIQQGEIARECQKNGSQFHFLPTASSASGDLCLTGQPSIYDAVFIGIPSNYRISVLESLVNNGVNIVIAGAQWHDYRGILTSHLITTSWINELDAFKLMQQAKVGINLAFDHPASRTDIHMSPRVFDYAAAGCVIVSDASPLISESFPDGIVHQGASVEEIVALTIDHSARYTTSESSRLFNRNLILDKHLYQHRIATMLDAID